MSSRILSGVHAIARFAAFPLSFSILVSMQMMLWVWACDKMWYATVGMLVAVYESGNLWFLWVFALFAALLAWVLFMLPGLAGVLLLLERLLEREEQAEAEEKVDW